MNNKIWGRIDTAPFWVPSMLSVGVVLAGDGDGDVNGKGDEGGDAPRGNRNVAEATLFPARSWP